VVGAQRELPAGFDVGGQGRDPGLRVLVGVRADQDQTLFIYTAEAGTASREALNLLISWSLSSVDASAR
jgi:hypothetical protein